MHARLATCVPFIIGALATPQLSNAGTVTGVVRLPVTKQTPDPYAKHFKENTSFVRRRPNPWLPLRPADPRPQMVVVLWGGPVADEAKTPPATQLWWELIGESFKFPLIAVQAGREVWVRYATTKQRTHHLSSPEIDAIKQAAGKDPFSGPLGPTGKRDFVLKALQTVEIRATNTPHVSGRAVAFPHPYFSLIRPNGKFEIANVPAGAWRIRVWYRDGWLDLESAVEVPQGNKRTKNIREPIVLPTNLKTKANAK